MHVGAILIFEGPPPNYVDLVEHVRGRLDQVPRFRQRLVVPPLEAGRPLWADDVNFNLTYHIRHTALPEPGGEQQLKRLAGAGLLPAARPLQAALGDVAGAGPRARPLRATDQDPPRDGRRDLRRRHRHGPLRPRAGPRAGAQRGRLGASARSRARPTWSRAAQRRCGGAGQACRAGGRGGAPPRDGGAPGRPRRWRGSARCVGAFADPAPDVPLNQPIGPHRRFTWARSELATFKRIKDALGGTVNDVVLAVVTGALREWLHGRGIRTEGLELRALVPVSIRTEDERGNLGNRIAAMRGPLPVYVEDPVRRLRVVSEQMEGLKRSKQALGAEVISRFNDFAPPTLLAQASRINFSTRLFNLIVTNVPGPQLPLYVLGPRAGGGLPGRLPAPEPRAGGGDHELQRPRRLRPARRLRLDGGRRGDRRRHSSSSLAELEEAAARRRPGLSRGPPRRPLHRRPDRRAVRDHPGRRPDRRRADPRPAARRRLARLVAAAPPGPRRLAALQRGDRPAPLPRRARSPTA